MARNPVTPVLPVDPVGAVRPVNSGVTYYRHLEQWRVYSEFYSLQRPAWERRTRKAGLAWIVSFHDDAPKPG